MAITIGTQLGSHEIIGLLGKGGMGEVYRARDKKLKREVAIKILPDEFARDPDRVSRFQREAEVLASLNHPNIAAIYDLQEANGSRFLVLELVEGDTLAGRLQRGSIPVDEALRIAKNICEALEAAHEKGVVHRDLKPGNVENHAGRQREGARLRISESARGLAGECHDVEFANTHAGRHECRRYPGHRRIHVARAGARPCRRSTQRCVLLRLRSLRDAHRPAGFSRRRGVGCARLRAEDRTGIQPASRKAESENS